MKLIKTTMVLCFLACAALGVNAQQKSPFNTEKAITASTDRMAADLGLDAGQKKQLLALNKERQQKSKQRMAEVKNATKASDKRAPKSVQQKAARDAQNAEKAYEQALRKLLNPAQIKKLDERKTKQNGK